MSSLTHWLTLIAAFYTLELTARMMVNVQDDYSPHVLDSTKYKKILCGSV